MLKLGLFLHAYQPSTQSPEVLAQINLTSYLPLFKLFAKFPQVPLTLNIAGSLFDLWASSGQNDLIERCQNIVNNSRLELVGSAKYHPLLPKLPPTEMERQISLQEKSVKKYFSASKLIGFFPPEMAYNQSVAQVVSQKDYSWILLDQSANPETSLSNQDLPELNVKTIQNLPLKVLFRSSRLSYLVAFSKVKTIDAFLDLFKNHLNNTGYYILAMDAETFGWHRPEQLRFLESLFEVYVNRNLPLDLATVTEICQSFPDGGMVKPLVSTWGSVPRWDNPENQVHLRQWELLNLAVACAGSEPEGSASRISLDQAVQSDQFWWASGNPCWHPLMVEKGSQLLTDAIILSISATSENRTRASDLNRQISLLGREKFGNKPVAC